MKIRKRHQPVDFSGITDGEPESGIQASAEVDYAAARGFRDPEPDVPPPAPEAATGAPLARAPEPSRVTAASPRTPVARATAPEAINETAPPAWPIYLAAFVVSVLWACAPIAFAWGYRRAVAPFDYDPFAFAVFALLALGPALFVWLAAYMIRQGQKLSVEARRAKAMADEMVAPALAAATHGADVVHGVREEIAGAAQAAQEARETLLALREAVAVESERLVQATSQSARQAQDLAQTLGRERTEMVTLSTSLDGQAMSVADAIARQARMVAEASDLAQTQLREAEAALAARAADLAAAAGETTEATRNAADDLTRHIARLETAGLGVREQISNVEAGLTEQRAGLVTISHALRSDQETFAAQAETATAKLSEFISQARLSTMEMGDRAVKGGEALRQLIAEAADQFRELSESAKAERDEFGQSTLHSLEAVSDAAAQERARLEEQTRAAISALAQAAEETRAAAAKHAEAARDQVDQLSEAAFTAGQQANKVFETRLAEARTLIEQSAHMVEQAGAATARKLDEGAHTARATLDELNRILGEVDEATTKLPARAQLQAEEVRRAMAQSLAELTEQASSATARKLEDGAQAARTALAELTQMLADIEDRTARLPLRARSQAEEVRQAVAASLEDLLDQARRTAEETQAIDEAFQERVRRNYEMLSDAVRLMGSVASVAPPPARERPALIPREPLAARSPRREPPPPAPEPEPAPSAEAPEEPLELDMPLAEPPPVVEEPPSRAARPRLRLTPTATDAEFAHVFEQAGGRATEEPGAGGEEGWTWKDLLSSLDETDERDGDADLAETLTHEISAMGIDPAALLPRTRIDEIAAAIQTRDLSGSREVVRRLAPAATRRLTRRILGDKSLQRQVAKYLARYGELLDDAVERDPEGFMAATLLSSDAGRTYLLLDAVAGERI
jgi:hypothetical protein